METFVLETKNLGISFGGLKAVQDVNLQVKKNQIYGLIGPNGAGKTTTLQTITGLIAPKHGEILFGGQNKTHFHKYNLICYSPT